MRKDFNVSARAYSEVKPEGCRFDDQQWAQYVEAANTRGALFFSDGTGLWNWVNDIYQRKMLKRPKDEEHKDHVGIILRSRMIVESTRKTGPCVGEFLDKYTVGEKGQLVIGLPKGGYEAGQVDQGIERLLFYIRFIRNQGGGGYDWLRLVSLGKLQRYGADICSILGVKYLAWSKGLEWVEENLGWDPYSDQLLLPNQLLDQCTILFKG